MDNNKQLNMKSILNYTIIALLSVASITSISAQKFAHINSQLLMVEMPEMKNADAQIQTYQESLMKKGQDMVQAFEAKYLAYAEEANKGVLNKIQMQQKEGELGKEQQAIQSYEQEVQSLLAQKRQSLYKPLIDKVKVAIEQVGKEGGYTMIFESGSGVLVHATESDDIMALVKTKVGM